MTGGQSNSPSVRAVVVNYNGRELLSRYLPSLLNNEYQPLDVTVVDNNSSDGSVRYLEENFPEVKVMANDENQGFSRANNLAAAESDSDYLWFVNSDVRVESDSLKKLIEVLEENPQAAIVVPQIRFMEEPHIIQSIGHTYDVFGRPMRNDEHKREPTNSNPHNVVYATGAAMLVDRTVWERIGGFDGDNFMFGDDVYFCLQAWSRGSHVLACPDSITYHEGGASRNSSPDPLIAYHHARNRTRTYLKTLQARTLAIGLLGFTLHSLGQVLNDVLVRHSLSLALGRLRGYLSVVKDLKEIREDRYTIAKHRCKDDAEFIQYPFQGRDSGLTHPAGRNKNIDQ